jgi:multiple sugar transport system substrate-binding protein
MRNWPTAYGLVDDPSLSTLEPEQIGIATIPAANPDRTHYSCLGGWNLMISDHTSPEKKEAAWTFIQFAVDSKQQKDRALGGGYLPTLHPLYDDPEVVGAHPVLDLGREAIENTRPRPASPYYSEMSPRIASAFTRTLRGEQTGTEATQQLAQELRTILRQG